MTSRRPWWPPVRAELCANGSLSVTHSQEDCPMQLTPYLNFNGRCEEAFKLYEKVLGGKITTMQTHGDSPMKEHTPPDWHKAILHACLVAGDQVLMGSDAPPQHYEQPKG